MAKKNSAETKKNAAAVGESATTETPKKSRKGPQPELDAAQIDKYADEFYEFAMAAYENMREGARIMRLCPPGTTVKPQSTNPMRQIRRIAGVSTEFVTKPAKAARDHGLDPKPKIK